MDLKNPQVDVRRHDLDALRGFAMLLGIVLHGSISFIPGAGMVLGVQDSQANPLFGVLLASIHGWRMSLFFLISGFFTAMVWQKRGLRPLLVNRFRRIFLPLLLALLTIIPLTIVVSAYVRMHPPVDAKAKQQQSPTEERRNTEEPKTSVNVFAAVANGDQTSLKSYLVQGGDALTKDPFGSTPLHVACLFGRAEAAELLLETNACLDATNFEGQRPEELLKLDWPTTAFIAQFAQVPVKEEDVQAGRKRIAQTIIEKTGRSVDTASLERTATSGRTSGSQKLATLLFYFPVFHHLWFLWFLCWYVGGFALIVLLVQILRIPALPRNWLTSAGRYLWLIPLTAVPQYFMAGPRHAYGPDTSVGLLPLPAVFAYYAVFFGYGAMYFCANDLTVAVGRGFWWKLPAAFLILFPAGLRLRGSDSSAEQILFAVLQVTYAWTVSFGMIGLFHRFCRNQRFWFRYLLDSSYWLYLAHIPLIIAMQYLVRDLAWPSLVKFGLVCFGTTGLLLVSYQVGVRNTWLGALLNGRRYPPNAKTELESIAKISSEGSLQQSPS